MQPRVEHRPPEVPANVAPTVKVTRFLFLATIFCVTFEKVHWNFAGTVSLADLLALGFLVMWALERLALRDRRLARTSVIAGVTYLGRRSERFFWRTIGVFTAGLVLNSIYGVLQLVAAQGGSNLDSKVLSPITGGASSINIYGAVEGQSVYRPNALTGDPNHLGIMLVVPLLALLPVYLRLPRGHR